MTGQHGRVVSAGRAVVMDRPPAALVALVFLLLLAPSPSNHSMLPVRGASSRAAPYPPGNDLQSHANVLVDFIPFINTGRYFVPLDTSTVDTIKAQVEQTVWLHAGEAVRKSHFCFVRQPDGVHIPYTKKLSEMTSDPGRVPGEVHFHFAFRWTVVP